MCGILLCNQEVCVCTLCIMNVTVYTSEGRCRGGKGESAEGARETERASASSEKGWGCEGHGETGRHRVQGCPPFWHSHWDPAVQNYLYYNFHHYISQQQTNTNKSQLKNKAENTVSLQS